MTTFANRSQAAKAAMKTAAPNEVFYTFDMPSPNGRVWKYMTHRFAMPEIVEWAKGFDWVHHVEVKSVDGFRTNETLPVLVITCTLEELTQDELDETKARGCGIEPLTPGLFKPYIEEKEKPAASREKSSVESPTKLVWQIADSMPGASKEEVVAACVEKGIHKSTAGTQFYSWKKSKSM